MRWSQVLQDMCRQIYQYGWVAVWLILLADSSTTQAKPQTGTRQVVTVHSTITSTISTINPTDAFKTTDVPSATKDISLLSNQMLLSKRERKLKRLEKQKLKKSKLRKDKMKKLKTFNKEQTMFEPNKMTGQSNYKSSMNMINGDISNVPIKSMSVAENDVLNKMDTFTNDPRELSSKILELESKLLKEMLRNRDVHNTLIKNTGWIDRLNVTVTENKENFTSLQSDVKRIQQLLKSEDEYHQSIEAKLAGVMLDISEVNNLLSTADKRAATKLEDKSIKVETTSESHCQNAPNATKYRDCEELYHHGHTKSGVYYITPLYSSCPVPVYCDMDTPPGGWMVFQRRLDGSTNFTQNWDTYRQGFGDVTKEFWLGNDNLFLLTNQRHYQLRIDLWDFYGSRVYADYLHFKIDGERDRYRLHVSNHSGTAPDGLHNHDNVYFSTPDRDNDLYQGYHCAGQWACGWWFSNCWFVILNGEYHNTTAVEYRGISWNDWKAEQLQKVEMKIRPSGY